MNDKYKLISNENDVLVYEDTSFVDLSGIKKRGNLYSWTNSIGCLIKFHSKNNFGQFVDGVVQIKGCPRVKNDYKLEVEYNGEMHTLCIHSVIRARFEKMLHKEFKYEINDTFCDEKGDITIIDRKRKSARLRLYKYKCNKCGYEGWKPEIDFEKGHKTRCTVCCSGMKNIIPGINDITTTAPWMVKYFQGGEEEAKLYSCGSGKKIEFKCPNCKRLKTMSINALRKYGLGCICTDGFSYPEKLLASFLDQLNIKYKHQLSRADFEWVGMYYYDFYLPDYDCIIETHGEQHYKEVTFTDRALDEEQKNDENKKILATDNHIKHYIELNCSESNLYYIKESIYNSQLLDLLKLNNIVVDWELCDKEASSNKIKEVCEYYENNKTNELKKDMARKFKIDRSTLYSYLKKGNKFGWCTYSPNERTLVKNRHDIPIKVIKDDKLIAIYNSAREIEKISEEKFGVILQSSTIMQVARHKYKYDTYKGYCFEIVS